MRIGTRRIAATAAIATAALLGLTACSSSDDAAPAATSATATTAAATGSQTIEPAPAGGAAELIGAELDGEALRVDLPKISCEFETDDGHRQIEFEAEDDAADIEYQVEIVLADTPRLDDLELELGDREWETADADRGAAKMTIDGDRYRVTAPVTEHRSGERGEATVEFRCPTM